MEVAGVAQKKRPGECFLFEHGVGIASASPSIFLEWRVFKPHRFAALSWVLMDLDYFDFTKIILTNLPEHLVYKNLQSGTDHHTCTMFKLKKSFVL